MKGLVEVLLQRSEMTGDGMHVMETVGQFPGTCEEFVWTVKKRQVRTCGSFSGVAGNMAWVFFCIGLGRSRGRRPKV